MPLTLLRHAPGCAALLCAATPGARRVWAHGDPTVTHPPLPPGNMTS